MGLIDHETREGGRRILPLDPLTEWHDLDCVSTGAIPVLGGTKLAGMETSTKTIQSPPAENRVAYSPSEFAALFGKHPTWGYRQLYRGTVKAITQYGRIMIPRTEVDRLLSTAKEYAGQNRPNPSTKRPSKSVTISE